MGTPKKGEKEKERRKNKKEIEKERRDIICIKDYKRYKRLYKIIKKHAYTLTVPKNELTILMENRAMLQLDKFARTIIPFVWASFL